MKEDILNRYHRVDGKVAIEVATDRVEDLYNNFDKSAPYYKKDLEQDLADYLIDCVRDIGKEPFVIRFRFSTDVDEASRSKVKTSIENYFKYLCEIETRELNKMTRSSGILLLIGIVVLSLSIWVNRMTDLTHTVSGGIFAEGLTIAAWISLWESLASFLINWPPKKRQFDICSRISVAQVFFDGGGKSS